MSIDGTWNLTVNTPMGAQQSTIEFTTDGDTLNGERHGAAAGLDLRRQGRRRQRGVEDRHHGADGADRPLPGDGRRRLALGHGVRRAVPAFAGHRAARLSGLAAPRPTGGFAGRTPVGFRPCSRGVTRPIGRRSPSPRRGRR